MVSLLRTGLALALALLGVVSAPASGLAVTNRANQQSKVTARHALPVVFVHGIGGSGGIFASTAERFASNGFPPHRIRMFEYDSSSGLGVDAAPDQLNELIDRIRAKYGVHRVNLVAHSLGTVVAANYLSDASRAAKVAHYVGIDGANNADCGIGARKLSCMGIFAGTSGDVGGKNVYLNHGQSHVESATSPKTFALEYGFLTDTDPRTRLILPEPPGRVKISGRAVNQSDNSGVAGARLKIWQLKRSTGARTGSRPLASFHIGPSGDWGPVKVNGKKRYEFELRRPDSAVRENTYYQPFIRDDRWVRLLSQPPNSPIVDNTITGSDHAAAEVIRYREWWTTHPSGNEDVLRIGTTSPIQGDQPQVNVLKNVVSDGLVTGLPSVTGKNAVWIHVHDNPADQVSSLDLIPYFDAQPFNTGVDLFMPASDPPDGTVSFRSVPRGDASNPQVLKTPNWASDKHKIAVVFNDYVQEINRWGECKREKPRLCQRNAR
jgi:hypothetical protein